MPATLVVQKSGGSSVAGADRVTRVDRAPGQRQSATLVSMALHASGVGPIVVSRP